MADFTLVGFIRSIKYMDDAVLVFIDEYKNGYKKSDGEIVNDRYISWKCIFKSYFKNYISKHFGDKMLVQVKGEVFPYAIEHDKVVEGISVIGQTINIFSYPRASARREMKAIRDSQFHSDGTPDLDDFKEEDF